eukprot:GHUV01041121.1.p1 GENE.GHUV01041121.1~~GHUV01041121.1.p1  ORF type:complete len:114 (+),score=26.10 GHUV01041121.1:92-433(+)
MYWRVHDYHVAHCNVDGHTGSPEQQCRSPAAALAAPDQLVIMCLCVSPFLLQIGLLAPLNSCQAWQMHKPSTELFYDAVLWTGSAQELQGLQHPIAAAPQVWICQILVLGLQE